MSSIRFARSALRARPAAFRMPLQRRGYAEAVSDKIKLSLVLPHQVRFPPRELLFVQVNIPAESGEMGVLANHVPSIEQLKPGLVEIVEESGANKKFYLSGGFAVVQPDSQLSINAVEGYPLEDFSAENVRAQIAEAQKIASGSGSEQDIAEAKIELESAHTGSATMTQELPTKFPTPISREAGLTEEGPCPDGHLFESPRRWRTKATVHEREGSSPILTQRGPCAYDALGGNENYKCFLFTFPRLYSDMTSERDPFLDSRGMPSNPYNTPISRSGHQSEVGSWGKNKQNALSPARSDKHNLDQLHNVATSSDNLLTSLFNGAKATSKPPKSHKPAFLSGIDLSFRSKMENIRPSLRVESLDRWEGIEPLPEAPYRSLPLWAGKDFGQFVERASIEQGSEDGPPRPKQSWETRSIVPCRYFPRPFTRQELDISGIPLNNPDVPFPAPIPTIDNLPLHRGIVQFDWKQVDQYPEDIGHLSTIKTNPATIAVWRLLQKIITLTNCLLGGLIPRVQGCLMTKETRTVHTVMTIPFISNCEASTAKPEASACLRKIDGGYILQVNFAFSLLYISRITMIAAAIRVCMSSKIVVMAASVVRILVEITIRWLLKVFRIEVAVELRRIQQQVTVRHTKDAHLLHYIHKVGQSMINQKGALSTSHQSNR
ncbi:hypothetical protein BDW59DRAFT_178866 [Aspergillus cavernicola]|uniref:ATP synthase subunit delta, mitochondrial n=1 Tax=Aspergillus cavernicola TaxID=176166 RepID=A0ABR4H9M8_9EURO